MPRASSKKDFSQADIGLASALPIELGAFLNRCKRVKSYKGGEFVFRGGVYDKIRVAVVESGTGFARARRATQSLIDAHSPPWVISCGFSGALNSDMSVGNIVMANSIVDSHGQQIDLQLDVAADPDKGLYVGRLLTADAIVRRVDDKRELGEKFGAVAVDLESLAVAQVCRERNTGFMSIRVISDDMSNDLPAEVLTLLGSTGTLRVGAALGAVWKRFGSVKDMWHLRENAYHAAERLAVFLDGVITQLHRSGK